jgi:hypothetical protein
MGCRAFHELIGTLATYFDRKKEEEHTAHEPSANGQGRNKGTEQHVCWVLLWKSSDSKPSSKQDDVTSLTRKEDERGAKEERWTEREATPAFYTPSAEAEEVCYTKSSRDLPPSYLSFVRKGVRKGARQAVNPAEFDH